MLSRPVAAALVGVVLLSGCMGDASGPGPDGGGGPGAGTVTATAADPAGDTFGNRGVQWDMTEMRITRDSGAITVTLEFSSALIAPTSGDTNAMIGFVTFDTDQDSTTGAQNTVDKFRRDGGASGMDEDYLLALSVYEADSSVTIFDESGTVTGRVKPVFRGRRVTIRIPLLMLGNDDGILNASALVGTLASPTDLVPEQGHLELGVGGGSARRSVRAPLP